jgi:hypothetical protein
MTGSTGFTGLFNCFETHSRTRGIITGEEQGQVVLSEIESYFRLFQTILAGHMFQTVAMLPEGPGIGPGRTPD